MDNGAHFHKCDFQVHSPRDAAWKGKKPTTDAERRAYADEFVATCRGRGLDAVAITDHHDVAFVPFIKDAAERETDGSGAALPSNQKLVVFPGIELTLGIPCQALVLFDATFPLQYLGQALTALGVQPAPAGNATHAETKALEHIKSLAQLYEELNRQEPLRNRFIVLPNVTDRGHKTLLRSAFAPHYKDIPCVGGYVDGGLQENGKAKGAKTILAGKDKSWGSKALGVFLTSDSRRADFSTLGKHHSWVKWAEPTAEALRQACLARHSRISHTEPRTPVVRVLSLEVSNSSFMGPVYLTFNGQYNSLIGGRGTGKSTLLEYLRWGLCDQPPAEVVSGGELPDFQKRRRNLINSTLAPLEARVTVSFLLNDIPHVVRRESASGAVYLKMGDAEFEPCTEDDVRSLVPIDAYSQKQLSNVGVRLDELKRFIHLPIKKRLETVTAKRSETVARLRAAYERVTRHRDLSKEASRFSLERKSIADRIRRLREGLKGLSEAERKVIEDRGRYEQEERLVEGWRSDLATADDALRSAVAELEGLAAPAVEAPGLANPELLKRMASDFARWCAETRGALATLRAGLADDSTEPALAEFELARSEWKAKADANQRAYEQARERAAEHEEVLQQITELEQRQSELDALVREKQQELQRLADALPVFSGVREDLRALHAERATLLEGQCEELTSLADGKIRASVRRASDTEPLKAELREALRGTKTKGDRLDALARAIETSGDPLDTWHSILDELELLAQVEQEGESSRSLPATPQLDAAGFTLRERTAIAGHLRASRWADLLVFDLADVPVFEYRVRESDYKPFQDASPGQQATALLAVLLHRTGTPLIIDQPEDDLNNKVISEVVSDIWQAKARRQLVFASHNANLVVNGDAELVACCDYRVPGTESGGQIKLEGAIDVPEIRNEITEVMEGGRDAFKLRFDKYGF